MSGKLLPCPFCGSSSIDAGQWMDGAGNSGPGCDDCGACAESYATHGNSAYQPSAICRLLAT